ncbi:hypothetical protein D3C76_1146380 [compost metagenome]
MLIRPHQFRTGEGKTIFYTRNWSQSEYFVTYRKLMGQRPAAPSSLVTHYMLFEKAQVAKLKQAIETRHGIRWYKAIIRSMNRKKQFAFSEFETYGNYLYSRMPGKVALRPARNRALHTPFRQLSAAKLKSLASRYRSISLHQRKDYTKRH